MITSVKPGSGRHGGRTSIRRHLRAAAWRFLAPAIVLYLVLFVLPVVGGIPLSFTRWDGLGQPQLVGLDNFASLLQSGEFLAALQHNVLILLAFLVLTNVMGLGLAILIHTRPRGYQVYQTVIFLPVILSLVATGFIWTLMLSPLIGIVNPALQAIGLGVVQPLWTADPRLALWTVVLVAWWQWGGVPMVIYGAGLKAIPPELLDAARIDGAGAWQMLRSMLVPLLRPAMAVTTVLTFVTGFQTFAVVYVLEGSQGAPGGATDVMGTLIYRDAFGIGEFDPNSNLGFAEANAIGLGIILGIALALVQWWFRRRSFDY
jgi:raffinose/stachyose/melibiose transport system permease protein